MKLEYFQGYAPNFGDELNPWMWPRLLPNFFDGNDKDLFLGVGSIIGDQYDHLQSNKIVFGSGYVPAYRGPPDLSKNWKIMCVRGPRTASALNLSPNLAICDSGILARTVFNYYFKDSPKKVSFIPHFEGMANGNWKKVCELSDINFIDPTCSVETVMANIASSKVVIAEAMHGAIIADAFRVPWIPVLPINLQHREKWLDWADSLELNLVRRHLWPSSLKQAQIFVERHAFLNSAVIKIQQSNASRLVSDIVMEIAARRLTHISKTSTFLSKDQNIERATDRLLTCLSDIKKYYQ